MLKNVLITCILIFSIHVQAQIKPQAKAAIDKRILNLFSSDIPREQKLDSLIKIKKECQNMGYNRGVIASGRTMMLVYMNNGNIQEAIKTANEIENLPVSGCDMIFSDIHRMKGLALGELGYDELSLKEFRTAIAYAKTIDDLNFRHYKLALSYENITAYFDSMGAPQDTILHYLRKSLEETQKIDEDVKVFPIDYKYDQLCTLNMNFGLFYMDIYKPQNIELAEKYFIESLKIYDSNKYNVLPASKMDVLSGLGSLYYTKKEYKKAVIYLEDALKLEKEYKNPMSRKEAYQILAKCYLELDNNDKSKEYFNLFTHLDDSLTVVDKTSVDISLNKIVADNKAAHDKKMQKTLLILSGIFVLLMIVFAFLWKRNNQKIHKSYSLLIDKLKLETAQPNESVDLNFVDENQNSNLETDTNFKEKTIHITDNTVTSLISKLERFEKSNKYVKKEVTLAYLASHLGTNTKYLSEIIKENKGKSFNDYINGLRIDYIAKQLYEEPKFRDYKISHLGELCGFASRQVFALVFKKHTGISPSFFIDSLKKDIDINTAI